jgi:hypothetical protein
MFKRSISLDGVNCVIAWSATTAQLRRSARPRSVRRMASGSRTIFSSRSALICCALRQPPIGWNMRNGSTPSSKIHCVSSTDALCPTSGRAAESSGTNRRSLGIWWNDGCFAARSRQRRRRSPGRPSPPQRSYAASRNIPRFRRTKGRRLLLAALCSRLRSFHWPISAGKALPPITVPSTLMSRNSSGEATSSGLRSSTVKSASLPDTIEPFLSSCPSR